MEATGLRLGLMGDFARTKQMLLSEDQLMAISVLLAGRLDRTVFIRLI